MYPETMVYLVGICYLNRICDYKPLGHLAYVEQVNAETIKISECNANYNGSPCGSREINKNDPIIKGYYL